MNFLTRCSVFLILGLSAFALHAQTPSPDQLRMLQQLPPAEQQAVLEAFAASSGIQIDQPVQFPELVQPVPEDEEEEDPEEEEVVDLELGFFEQDIELEPFGYGLFAGVPTTFAPATDIPVPPEYKIGPGDTIEVQLFGKENRQYSLVVTRDGTINFPNIGPVNVIGLDFQALKQDLLDKVSSSLIGTSAAISMGALRSIRVFVLGDATRPGSYTVSGLSTMTNALFLSGGVSEVGSLRNIQLKRNGQLIQTLDLYDLLIKGDTKNDVRLQSGDVIFIPPIGPTVGVGGYVKRPAIYELKNEKAAADIIQLAGGYLVDAFPAEARIERITAKWERAFLNLNLATQQGQQTVLQSGDIVLVPPVLERYRDGVRLTGHVLWPGDFEWRPGLRLTDIVSSLDELKPQADINYVLIRRETVPDQRVQAISADLEAAIANPGSEEDIYLQQRDIIRVFNLETERAERSPEALLEAEELGEELLPTDIQILVNELQLQATSQNPFEIVTIGGPVRAPGIYPYEEGMRLSDLMRAGAGLAEDAYTTQAELSRFEVIDGVTRITRVITVSPAAVMAGDPAADILLEPYDSLQIRGIQEWRDQQSVLLEGEVRFPGRYSFNPGDTLASIVERAGGLTSQAFPQGSVFLREELRIREAEQIKELTSKIESDLASLQLQAANENSGVLDAQNAGESLLTKLRNTRATGRLVIDLPAMLENPESNTYKVLVKDNDRLLIPDISQDVTVLGEVQFPTSHLYMTKLNRDDYIDRSGGITLNAAKKQIYVVKANGAVLAGKGFSWFGNGARVKIEQGDTIVVPLDTQRVSKLTLWTQATTLAYNLAIVLLAVNSL